MTRVQVTRLKSSSGEEMNTELLPCSHEKVDSGRLCLLLLFTDGKTSLNIFQHVGSLRPKDLDQQKSSCSEKHFLRETRRLFIGKEY